MLQPDLAMLEHPSKEMEHLEEVPNLVAEIGYSSHAYDPGPKIAAYRSVGVREYVPVLPGDQRVKWRVKSGMHYRLLRQEEDGIFGSSYHDRLWLDPRALFPFDQRRFRLV